MSESQRGASQANDSHAKESRDDLIRNTQSGRRDADEIDTTPASSGGGADTGITGDDGPGGGLTGPGAGLPDTTAQGTGGPDSGEA